MPAEGERIWSVKILWILPWVATWHLEGIERYKRKVIIWRILHFCSVFLCLYATLVLDVTTNEKKIWKNIWQSNITQNILVMPRLGKKLSNRTSHTDRHRICQQYDTTWFSGGEITSSYRINWVYFSSP